MNLSELHHSWDDAQLRLLAPWEYHDACEQLKHAGLIAADLPAAHISLFGLYKGNEKQALGGFERYGREALLRSMVVPPARRNRGTGARLLEKLEALLFGSGIENIWLLTMTAESFFAKYGYQRAERSRAPQSIRQASQFSGLCPASATLMVKKRNHANG